MIHMYKPLNYFMMVTLKAQLIFILSQHVTLPLLLSIILNFWTYGLLETEFVICVVWCE